MRERKSPSSCTLPHHALDYLLCGGWLLEHHEGCCCCCFPNPSYRYLCGSFDSCVYYHFFPLFPNWSLLSLVSRWTFLCGDDCQCFRHRFLVQRWVHHPFHCPRILLASSLASYHGNVTYVLRLGFHILFFRFRCRYGRCLSLASGVGAKNAHALSCHGLRKMYGHSCHRVWRLMWPSRG